MHNDSKLGTIDRNGLTWQSAVVIVEAIVVITVNVVDIGQKAGLFVIWIVEGGRVETWVVLVVIKRGWVLVVVQADARRCRKYQRIGSSHGHSVDGGG